MFKIPGELISKVTGHIRTLEPFVVEDTERRLDNLKEVSELGEYFPCNRSPEIVIYTSAIQQLAEDMKCSPDHLKTITILHEYAHATDHHGIKPNHPAVLANPDSGLRVLGRLVSPAFQMQGEWAREQIAQLVTHAAISNVVSSASSISAKTKALEIQETFKSLMARQPSSYRIEDLMSASPSQVAQLFAKIKSRKVDFKDCRNELKQKLAK